ncbi:hypothetical protein [Caulobacter phage KcrB]|nr:hypothetical protein RW_GP061 [Caulobacter phage RW]WCA46365.1 hypothetical protein [Caulobacter phage KcrB]WCD56300.1 hypothetical protein [Caulobacter phage RLK]WNV48092.1 hypothetical protein GB2A_gp060 [Caulobacter phage GB2A]
MTRSVARAWSEEDDAVLLKDWARGRSASVIGMRLGRSRCAVLGRLYRLGALNEDRKAVAPERLPAHRPFGNKHASKDLWTESLLTEKWADRKARLAKERAQGATQ